MRALHIANVSLSPNIDPGDFYLKNQNGYISIGTYIEFQTLDNTTIRIIHSLTHNPSFSEIVHFPHNYGNDLFVHRMSSCWVEDYRMFVPNIDYPQWPEYWSNVE